MDSKKMKNKIKSAICMLLTAVYKVNDLGFLHRLPSVPKKKV